MHSSHNTSFLHDCRRDHLQILPPEHRRPNDVLVPRSYDAEELKGGILDIVGRVNVNNRQAELLHTFLVDYLASPEPSRLTMRELRDFLELMAEHIDRYFFHGGLTQGDSKHFKLWLVDAGNVRMRGYWQPWSYTVGRITLYVRGKVSDIYFNRCPNLDLHLLVEGEDGHGILWQEMYRALIKEVREWHPSLYSLEFRGARWPWSPIYDWAVASTYDPFFRWLYNEERMSLAWEGLDFRPQEPAIFKNRLWRWKPRRKEEFKRALMRLTYTDYDFFISTEAPYPERLFIIVFIFKFELSDKTSK
ncbi:hypothetical protein NUW58_g4940 [Xylaria curta]|uniref:Uncharacterized protein n=1 Tax=Xylaria curta TaxID=42375 RepID=A0ACC1P482_9PEZI|nr:hypothetical protein NUW58_g4940 [Xylaria curta]